jgi:hypothetical protein
MTGSSSTARGGAAKELPVLITLFARALVTAVTVTAAAAANPRGGDRIVIRI